MCDLCHMSMEVISSSYCKCKNLSVTATSVLMYIICDRCHIPTGVISDSYCNHKYCTFTVSSILTYILRDFCHMPFRVISSTYSNSPYCILSNFHSNLNHIISIICDLCQSPVVITSSPCCKHMYCTFILTSC